MLGCAAGAGSLRRRAVKRGKHLPDMPDEERHELRIALKNLRYAAEFFGSLFGKSKEVRSYLGVVAELQEDLGAHNDAATAKKLLAAAHLDQAKPALNEAAAAEWAAWYHVAEILLNLDETITKQ